MTLDDLIGNLQFLRNECHVDGETPVLGALGAEIMDVECTRRHGNTAELTVVLVFE